MGFIDDAFGSGNQDVMGAKKDLAPASAAWGFTPATGGTFGTDAYQGAQTPGQMNGDLAMVQKATAADPAQQEQMRQAQQGLIGQFQQQAAGLGPSVAQAQLRQATDRNQAQALGLIASQRGQNPGAAAYHAGQVVAGANQQAAGQSTVARMQEQQAAQQGLAGVSGQARGQDLQLGQQQQQASQFDANQHNQVLAALQQQRAQLEAQRNAQIAEMERQRQQAKFGLRDKAIGAGFDAGGTIAGGAAKALGAP